MSDKFLECPTQSEKPINIGAWSQEHSDRARETVERSRLEIADDFFENVAQDVYCREVPVVDRI
jgi:hypothetical protein